MGRALRYLLLAIVGLIVLAVLALATPPGRGILLGMIERGAASAGLTVSIEGASGWPPFTLGAAKVTIADVDGPFAEIENLAVNIKTTALLVGQIAFDSIVADRVAVEREPHLPGGGGSGGAALPFAANAVSVARLELGEALAGHPAVLSLAGSLVSGSDGSLSASVNAERIDGRTGTLKATITRASGNTPFVSDISLAEDADGILVGLIGRGSGPGYQLAAKTTASGDAVEGSLSLSSNGAAHFSGQFTLSPAGDAGQRLTAAGDGDLAELVPAEYADLLSGAINVAVDADWAAGVGGGLPRIAIRQGALSTGNVRAEVSGTLSDAVADLALKLDAAKMDGSPISIPLTSPASRVTSVTLTGKVAPAGNNIRIDLIGRVAGLETSKVTVPGAGISLALEADQGNPLAGGKLPFGLRVEANSLQTPTGTIESTSAAPILLTAEGTLDIATMSAEGSAKVAIAGGTIDYAGTFAANGVKGRANANFADLAPLSPLAGRAVSGGIALASEGTLAGPQAAFKIGATATNLNPGEPISARLLGGETKLSATIGSSDGRMTIDDLAIVGAAVNASGNLALAGDQITGALKGGVSDLALIAEASTGAGTFDATVSGSTSRPVVDATVTIAQGKLLDQPVENALIHISSAPSPTGWLAALELSGAFAGKPLTGKAGAQLDTAGLLSIPDVDLSIGENRITGSVQGTAEGPLSGTLSVDAPNLQTLAALALTTASGSGQAQLQFAPDGARQSVAVTFNADGVAYQTIAAGKISGDVHIDDAFGTPLVRGNATASAMTVGGLQLDSADVTATVEGAATRFTANAKGRDLDLAGSGTLSAASNGQTVRLDSLNGRAFGLPVALNAPVAVNLGSGTSGISGAVLALGGGTIRVDGAVSPALNLTVGISGVSATVANGFAPTLGAEGTITGQAKVTGQPAAPVIAWQAEWTGLRVAASRNAGLPGLSLSARGNGSAKATNIDARLTGAGLDLAISGDIPFAGAGLNVRASGTAPLALLALESNRELRLAGNAQVNLALSGSLASIATSGTLDLTGATIADTNSGFGVANATGRIAFDGKRATVQQLTGKLAQGGDIVVAGSVAIDSPTLPAALTVKVSNGRYADADMINTAFNADLAINGPILGNGTVSGAITLGRTEIQLPDRLAGAATAIDVTHRNAPRGFKPPKARETTSASGPAGGSGGLNLDIALTGNSGLFVRGFGIDAELGGSLKLTGTTGYPLTVGAFQMQRGRIEALGRRFDFQRGTLTFAGDLVPLLDFEATTTSSDGTVTLHVTGPANDPQISFTSSPDLPEEEILSRLLFNRSVGTLSPLQAAQLVDAVAQLTGAVGSGGIFARIREATGLDDLDIRQSASGGTTVGIGKRINDNLRVGVEGGTDSAAGRVIIDLDLTKNLKARGEAGQDGSGKVGLTYEREY